MSGSSADLLRDTTINVLQGLAASEIKDFINAYAPGNDELRAALHAITACAGASAQSADCGSGALGAAGSVILNNLIEGLNDPKLTESQKNDRINLINTIIAGVTELAGGDSAVANAAATIEAENNQYNNNGNFLSDLFGASRDIAEYQCYQNGVCDELSDSERQLIIYEQTANIAQEITQPYGDAAQAMLAVGEVAVDFTPVLGDAKALAEAESLFDYAIFVVGVVPGVGDTAAALLRQSRAALRRGDAEAAQRLAQEAQDLLAGVHHKPGGSGVSSGGATHTGSSPIQGGEVKPNLPVGEISSRPLTQSDLGINGVLSELKGTYSLNNGIAIVRVDMIRGEINNPLQIVGNLIDSAKSNGATTLRIEGTIANEQLLRVLQRRYGLNTQGANDVITINLN